MTMRALARWTRDRLHMAFLDELKKEAQARKDEEACLTQARVMEMTQSFLLVQKKFGIILTYLQELANHLNAISLGGRKSYYIDGCGTIDDFRPDKYTVNAERLIIDQKSFIGAILLKFICRTERELVVEKNSPALIDMQRDYLWQSNLKFQCTEFKNTKGHVERASFKVEGEIPVHIRFSADFEQGRISLSLRNFNGLTTNEFTYDADEIDNALLEEFAKYLVGKQNNFISLGRHQQALKQRVAATRASVEYAKLDPETEARLDGPKEAKKGLLGSLKSLLSKG